jgi:hypothetical protein
MEKNQNFFFLVLGRSCFFVRFCLFFSFCTWRDVSSSRRLPLATNQSRVFGFSFRFYFQKGTLGIIASSGCLLGALGGHGVKDSLVVQLVGLGGLRPPKKERKKKKKKRKMTTRDE